MVNPLVQNKDSSAFVDSGVLEVGEQTPRERMGKSLDASLAGGVNDNLVYRFVEEVRDAYDGEGEFGACVGDSGWLGGPGTRG